MAGHVKLMPKFATIVSRMTACHEVTNAHARNEISIA